MAKYLSVVVDDRPGHLTGLGEATGGARGNLGGARYVATGGAIAIVPILVGDVAATRGDRASAGLVVRDEREVVVVDVEDRPGRMARVVCTIADAAVKLDLAYTACGGVRLVLGVGGFEHARAGWVASVAGPGCLR
jgi:hypothetical protein